MDPINLIWIIPLAAWFGFGLAAAVAVGKRGETSPGAEVKK